MRHIFMKLAAFATMTLLCSGTILLDSNARAQCPSDIEPDSIPWSGPDTSTYNNWSGSTLCIDTVVYCSRVVGDTTEKVISEIILDTACDTTNWVTLIKNISATFFCCNPDRLCPPGLPPCPATPPYATVEAYFTAQCWFRADGPPWGVVILKPCPTLMYCRSTYALCCDLDMGFVGETLLSTVALGTCDYSPAPNNGWPIGTCFSVDRCN